MAENPFFFFFFFFSLTGWVSLDLSWVGQNKTRMRREPREKSITSTNVFAHTQATAHVKIATIPKAEGSETESEDAEASDSRPYSP